MHTLTGIMPYVLLVGADGAVMRAGVMGGLLVMAIYLGVLDRLAGAGIVKVLHTDEHGTIEFVTEGQRLWLNTERQPWLPARSRS